MQPHTKKQIQKVIYHIFVCGIGLVMIYPLIWMVCSSFKPTSTIFQTAGSLIPETFTLETMRTAGRASALSPSANSSRIPFSS